MSKVSDEKGISMIESPWTRSDTKKTRIILLHTCRPQVQRAVRGQLRGWLSAGVAWGRLRGQAAVSDYRTKPTVAPNHTWADHSGFSSA